MVQGSHNPNIAFLGEKKCDQYNRHEREHRGHPFRFHDFFLQPSVQLHKATKADEWPGSARGTAWIINRGCSLIKGIWTVVMAPARDNDTRQNSTKCFYNRPVSACGQTRRARQDHHMDQLVTAALKKETRRLNAAKNVHQIARTSNNPTRGHSVTMSTYSPHPACCNVVVAALKTDRLNICPNTHPCWCVRYVTHVLCLFYCWHST